MSESFLDGRVVLHHGDSRDVLRAIPDNSIDSVVTDPPYALVSIVKRFGKNGAAPAKGNAAYERACAGFMGKQWDTGETAFAVEFWAEVYRVLKPGGHVIAASGTRTYHRLAVAIEDAGFEIRDMISWLYGSGFPKSHDVSKGIDKASGVEREKSPTVAMQKKGSVGEISKNLRCAECGKARASGNPCTCPRLEDNPATPEAARWQGWGTALKPACEPWVLARKPLGEGTVAANVLAHGVGGINIDGCRVGDSRAPTTAKDFAAWRATEGRGDVQEARPDTRTDIGRFPANVIHDGSDEVVDAFPHTSSGSIAAHHVRTTSKTKSVYGERAAPPKVSHGDSGSASRFFYSAKADADDRLGSKHPTVKPVDLMQYLCRLVTPPSGTVLDPFAGSGTTGEAAWREGFNAILIEREEEYCIDIRERLKVANAGPMTRRAATQRQKAKAAPEGLFAHSYGTVAKP